MNNYQDLRPRQTPKLPPVWRSCVPRTLRTSQCLGVSLLLILNLGCTDGRVYVDANPREEELAKEAVVLVENGFRKLASDDPIVTRYGEFVSLEPGQVIKGRAHQVFDLECPATVVIKRCHCVFSKYSTKIDIVIAEGSGPRVVFELSQHAPNDIPVEREGELGFEHGKQGENGSHRAASRIECRVFHPDFQP